MPTIFLLLWGVQGEGEEPLQGGGGRTVVGRQQVRTGRKYCKYLNTCLFISL
jgi:hypothetical protein